jgi:hypothetical protein
MAADFGLETSAEEVAEAVAPVFTLDRGRGHLAFGDVQRVDKVDGSSGNMAAGPVERLHAVAHGINALFTEVDVDYGVVCLEVFTLHRAFHCPDIVFETERELAEMSVSFDGTAGEGDILRYGAVNECKG